MAEKEAGAVETVEVVKEAKPEAAKPAEGAAARPKPSLDTFTGVDWTKFKDEEKTALQAEMDRRMNVARENAARRAKKETEAFYRGRESARPAADPQKQEPAKTEDKPPVREDFESYEAFFEAKAEYVGTKAARTATAKAHEEAGEKAAREAESKRITEFQGKVRSKYPDIDDRLAEIGDLPMHKGVQEAIAESEFGPEILDSMVSNPAEFDRLFKLSQTAAIREIGRMEARFEAAKTPATIVAEIPAGPVKKPSAPAPIKPGGGGAGTEDMTPKDSDDINDWMRKERARERKLRA